VTELMTLVRELESRWALKGSDEHEAPALGLDREEVVATLKASGLRAPAEVIDWYSWHNGVAPEEAGSRWVQLAPSGFHQLSLQESLDEREAWTQHAAQSMGDLAGFLGDEAPEMLEPSYWWEPTWLPIGSQPRQTSSWPISPVRPTASLCLSLSGATWTTRENRLPTRSRPGCGCYSMSRMTTGVGFRRRRR
jgi:cell wall assembly regulator SMI1